MKILCISKQGKFQKYVTNPSFYEKHNVVTVGIDASDDEIISAGADAEVIVVDAITKVSERVINSLPNLKMIHSEGVAFNAIDLEAAKAKGVYVCNCKGMNATAVAEQSVLLMLGLLRDVIGGDRDVRAGKQIEKKTEYMINGSLKEIADCTIGFVGFGDIAIATAKMLRAMDGRIVYYKRTPLSKEEEEKLGATYMPLDELLRTSDIVSMNTPVTPETKYMANAEFFAKMKKGAYLVNTGRGELVDSKALLDAIRSGHIAGAGLDTLENEPVGLDNPIFAAEKEVEDKLLLTCHIGGITASSFTRGFKMIEADIESIYKGQRPEHIVNGL